MVDLRECAGCRDDFYNRGEASCWSRPKARLVTRYRIHRDTRPGAKGAFAEVRVPDCYRSPPMFFIERLPDFVRPADVVRRRNR